MKAGSLFGGKSWPAIDHGVHTSHCRVRRPLQGRRRVTAVRSSCAAFSDAAPPPPTAPESWSGSMLSALLIVGACLCCLRYGAAGEARWLVLAGVLLGLIGMTRYFSLILMVPALA